MCFSLVTKTAEAQCERTALVLCTPEPSKAKWHECVALLRLGWNDLSRSQNPAVRDGAMSNSPLIWNFQQTSWREKAARSIH